MANKREPPGRQKVLTMWRLWQHKALSELYCVQDIFKGNSHESSFSTKKLSCDFRFPCTVFQHRTGVPCRKGSLNTPIIRDENSVSTMELSVLDSPLPKASLSAPHMTTVTSDLRPLKHNRSFLISPSALTRGFNRMQFFYTCPEIAGTNTALAAVDTPGDCCNRGDSVPRSTAYPRGLRQGWVPSLRRGRSLSF